MSIESTRMVFKLKGMDEHFFVEGPEEVLRKETLCAKILKPWIRIEFVERYGKYRHIFKKAFDLFWTESINFISDYMVKTYNKSK